MLPNAYVFTASGGSVERAIGLNGVSLGGVPLPPHDGHSLSRKRNGGFGDGHGAARSRAVAVRILKADTHRRGPAGGIQNLDSERGFAALPGRIDEGDKKQAHQGES